MRQVETKIMEAPTSQDEVLEAARGLAAALAETPEYQALEQAQRGLQQDVAAQGAIRAVRERQRTLGWKLQTGLISDAERAQLQRLQDAMFVQPAVQAYADAQQRLAAVCQEVAGLISDIIGLSFAASCGPGCSCG